MPHKSRSAGLKMVDEMCSNPRCARRGEHEVLHLWRDGEGRWWGRFRCVACEYVWQGALNLRRGRQIVSTPELPSKPDLRNIPRR